MRSVTLMKCAHSLCHCLVEAGQKFCSTTCKNGKKSEGSECSCGDPGCENTKKFKEEKAEALKLD